MQNPKILPKKLRSLLWFVVALVVSGAAARGGELLRYEASADAMGSLYTVAAYGEDQQGLENAVNAAFEEVRRLDRMLSNYRPNSEWSKVNREAALKPVPVSKELFDLLSACVEYSRKSDGAFDITVGPLMKVWGFYKGTGRLPSKTEVAETLKEVGWRNLILDREALTVKFAKPGVEIDPGGIGKGYAVDRMIDTLKQNGISIALVSAAGSSIYALGAPPSEPRGWELDIRHPKDETRTVETVFLKDKSMSTSGNYEKFFEAEGKIYSHIMDPRTGFPAEGVLSVSVIAAKTLESEAWTKPFFINGRQWAERHKPKDLRVYLCEDKAELACAWLQ